MIYLAILSGKMLEFGMKIYTGSDHRAIELNNLICSTLDNSPLDLKDENATGRIECVNIGPSEYVATDDYVDYSSTVATNIREALYEGKQAFGVLSCGSGIGMLHAANKYPFIRATMLPQGDPSLAKAILVQDRLEHDSNVLVIASDTNPYTKEELLEIITTWTSAPFGFGRHLRRVNKAWYDAKLREARISNPFISSGVLSNEINEVKRQILEFKKFMPLVGIDLIDGTLTDGGTISAAEFTAIIGELSANNTLKRDDFLSLHLMTKNPLQTLKELNNIPQILSVFIHAEAENSELQEIMHSEWSFQLGITLNPETSVQDYLQITQNKINALDLIQIMTVTPGRQGNSFNPACLDKISELRQLGFTGKIAVDGAVNPTNISKFISVKPDIYFVGSYFSNSDNPKSAFEEIIQLTRVNNSTSHVNALEQGEVEANPINTDENLDISFLEDKAKELRISVLEQIGATLSGHLAGPFSCADIVTYLYYQGLKHNPENPKWEDRDYFLISNGHVTPIWYAALADTGYFPKSDLLTLRKFGSHLQGHPKYGSTPGVENSSGPLGHGIGQAVGIALSLKMDKKPNRVVCLMSDGEQQEGAVWESALSAAKYNLDNLTFILDLNDIQIDGFTKDIMPLPNMANIYREIGFEVIEIDGHDFSQIHNAYLSTKPTPTSGSDQSTSVSEPTKHNSKKPRLIIAHTTSGKGLESIENDYSWHDWRGDKATLDSLLAQLR